MKKSTTMDCAMTGKAGSNVEDFMIEDLSYEKDVQALPYNTSLTAQTATDL
jgi:hypothetical protein